MPRKAIKPVVSRISDWGYQIIYKCGKCGYGFAMAHDGYDYCPHCGSKIDWGVMWEANEEWRHAYMSADNVKRELMKKQIEEYNQTITDGEKRVMEYTDATRRAVTKSNINYYLGQGWSKEDLIKKAFFTEKDFEDAGL